MKSRKEQLEYRIKKQTKELRELLNKQDSLISDRDAKVKSMNDSDLDGPTVDLLREALIYVAENLLDIGKAISRKKRALDKCQNEIAILNKVA